MSFVILTNRHHVIVDCDKKALVHMRCASIDDLIGQSITTIMSETVGCLHNRRFFDQIPVSDLKSVIKRLENHQMSMASRNVLYTTDRSPMMCKLRVTVQLENDFTICGYIVAVTVAKETYGLLDTVPQKYTPFIGSESNCLSLFNNVTCVIMDLCNSTCFVNSCDPFGKRIALVLSGVYNIVKREILCMYPYMYVHELIGDSVFVVFNAGFFVRTSDVLHDACLAALRHIQQKVDSYLKDTGMWLRIGVATGPVHAGVIDGRTFRLFGLTVHRAQRLESVCPKGQIAIDQSFKDQLRGTHDYEIRENNLKGIGHTSYYVTTPNANRRLSGLFC